MVVDMVLSRSDQPRLGFVDFCGNYTGHKWLRYWEYRDWMLAKAACIAKLHAALRKNLQAVEILRYKRPASGLGARRHLAKRSYVCHKTKTDVP